ncbi:MAG: acetate/propionate family kinase [Gemmataceae bacterium]
MTGSVLTLNGGSSSIKFALFSNADPSCRTLTGAISRIGLTGPTLSVRGETEGPFDAPNLTVAADRLLEWLDGRVGLPNIAAVGHRVVHGGPHYAEPQLVSSDLIAELQRLVPLDPAHLPGELALIEAVRRYKPELPQVACFDTAFHHHLPRIARMLPIPRRYESQGVRRYGFHGLSFAYLMQELARLDPPSARGRIILAHLGNGASMAAVRDGQCVDTTMGFTPTGGLVMGSRTGDLDPGLLIYLARHERLTADQIDELVNQQSGLLGISETSSDMRELLERRATDERAGDAVAVFCHTARKSLAALAAVLGGVDTVVFSGGIGEHSPVVRAEICQGLDFLGIWLDGDRNAANAPVISARNERLTVRVIPTDEEAVIVGSVRKVLGA